jgi:ribonuclease HII
VAAAAILPESRRAEIDGLTDSKLLTPLARERIYEAVVATALAWAVVIIPPEEVDRRGLHVCNLAAMRRALASLTVRPSYVLTDGFPVDGLGTPGLAVWKGDQVAACVAAASVVAKVTRDRIMCELDEVHPGYGFAEHKGYVTPEHSAALDRYGPCPEHRFSYVNVAARVGLPGGRGTVGVASEERARRGRLARERMPLQASVGDNGGMEGGPR